MSLTGILLRVAAQTVWKPTAINNFSHSFHLTRTLSSVTDKEFFLFPDDYVRLLKLSEKKLHEVLTSPTRYQSIDAREDRTDFAYNHSVGRYYSKYRGAFLMKNPNDLSVYYQLFTHVRPKTVFEMGTCTGASATWYDDTAKSLDLDCHIYSVDINPALLNEELKERKPDTIDFITGDVTKIEVIFPPSMLEPLPHPWLIVEDSHKSATATIEYLNQFMKVGDYLVIEDTSPNVPYEDSSDKDTTKWGEDKLDLLKRFLRSPLGQNFRVDSFFTDLYGYNCTWHWHGFLRKIKQ